MVAAQLRKHPEDYKGCRGGSRKCQIRKTFDEYGERVALALGIELGLQRVTVTSWCQQWRREQRSLEPQARASAVPRPFG